MCRISAVIVSAVLLCGCQIQASGNYRLDLVGAVANSFDLDTSNYNRHRAVGEYGYRADFSEIEGEHTWKPFD